MSFIRALEHPEWEEGIGDGWYVYGSTSRKEQEELGPYINFAPQYYRTFVEIAMRMLDQSGELDDETLDAVHAAFRERLGIDQGTVGKHRGTQPEYE